MQDLKLSLKMHLQNNQTLIILFLVIALIGFLDATHLTISHFTGASLNCGEGGGCNVVTSTKWSEIFGIPVALFGAMYYLSMLTSAFAFLQHKKRLFVQYMAYMPIMGLLASGWFVYLQLFVIHAICVYCMGSALSSTLLFILSIFIKKRLL